MKSRDIRIAFLNYFKQHGHEIVPSSSLIPAEDPTLLFANAGMNQFKDVFLGKEKRSYVRAASIQKCMRAGGKHNDLENVGYTKRHLTFFEMMGNFSFGDYFKKEAIAFAWDFLTNHMKLDKETLYVTVFTHDDEAYDIWHHEIGLPEYKIIRLGAQDNFWQMGDTGPCGPCTEIYVDRGSKTGCGSPTCAPGCSCDRFLEVWNNVFMQFNRQPDGTDKLLAQTGVDTGMGLERLALIVQNKDSVFETDIFQNIIKKTEELTGVNYATSTGDTRAAFHVLADHIRASSFLIADGVSPSNEGRGYVLRKVIRRAALFAQKLTDKNIFPQLAQVIVEDMGEFYPELIANQSAIQSLLTSEIEKFSLNLVKGQLILREFFTESRAQKMITGNQLFKLYDTYGFPLELTKVIAHEHGYQVDEVGFAREMEAQRAQSGKKTATVALQVELDSSIQSHFVGYHEMTTATKIVGLVHEGRSVSKVPEHTRCWVITEKSPFYVERGGQVSDEGWLAFGDKKVDVLDLCRFGEVIAAEIQTPCDITVGQNVTCIVNESKRLATMKNHTATHLLQSALISLFGKQIKQAGSLVAPDYLRFDFTYHQNLTPAEIKQVEDLVNQKIMDNTPVTTVETSYKQAIAEGTIAFFGDKYNPDRVRMVVVPEFSKELCGGTHVRATGDIGLFKITEVTALSAGQRRIVAVTGPKAVELAQEDYAIVKTLSHNFKVQPHEIIHAVAKLHDQVKELHMQLHTVRKESWKAQLETWVDKLAIVDQVPFAYIEVEDQAEQLKDIATALLQKKAGLYVIVNKTGTAYSFIATLSESLNSVCNMTQFAQFLKDECGLRGGLKGNMMQGGSSVAPQDIEKKVVAWLLRNFSVSL